jgi:hypothetical protein
MPADTTKGRRWRFEELIAESEVPLVSLTPTEGIGLMTQFFRGEFVEGMMLTASWGIVDRSGEETYGFGISMVFDESTGDGVSSLSLLFKIGSLSYFGDFANVKMHWCPTPDYIQAFRSGIEGSPPFDVWGRSRVAEVSLVWTHQSVPPPEPPIRPGARMTTEEWRHSEDAVAMLKALRATWSGDETELVRLTHRYLLACCRAIWQLLPIEASRRGVEVAEFYADGRATRDEFFLAEWHAEGAAFFFDQFEHEPRDEAPEEQEARLQYEADQESRIDALVKEIEEIPAEELRRLVHLEASTEAISPRQLLADAAYFADDAMNYLNIGPRESEFQKHRKFLSAPLLRELVGDLFCPSRRGKSD